MQWQYAWCTCTAMVTVEYRDTLTEGYWCSGSTRGVRVLPRLLWSTGVRYWCSGSTRGVRVLPRLLWSTGINVLSTVSMMRYNTWQDWT